MNTVIFYDGYWWISSLIHLNWRAISPSVLRTDGRYCLAIPLNVGMIFTNIHHKKWQYSLTSYLSHSAIYCVYWLKGPNSSWNSIRLDYKRILFCLLVPTCTTVHGTMKETRLFFLHILMCMSNLKYTMHFLDTWTVNIQIRA